MEGMNSKKKLAASGGGCSISKDRLVWKRTERTYHFPILATMNKDDKRLGLCQDKFRSEGKAMG